MPIRPENKARYPKNWKSEIVPMIRARSGNRCECTGQCGVNHNSFFGLDDPLNRCGIGNGDVSYMTPDGKWHPCMLSEEGEEMERRDGKVYRAVWIVLTVMHLDHTPENCDPANLLHACQGCHNRYDMPVRRAGIQARRHAANAVGDFFCHAE